VRPPLALLIEHVAFRVSLDERLVSAARQELLDRSPAKAFRWGYLLGVEGDAAVHMPAASALAARLYEEAVAPEGEASCRDYALSFIKVADGPPPEASEGVHYNGFHLDTHPEVDGSGAELARLLFNLADGPRRFRYAAIDRFELARRGCEVPRSDYQVVDLPAEVETHVVEIPPRSGDRVHALRFWASVVPHVGVDDEHGHFLASYEAVAPVSPI
jgi:hypothetical protein